MKGFDRIDSSALGFAVTSLFYGAISMEEFHQWAAGVLEQNSEDMDLLLGLVDFTGPPAKIYGVIGFVPDWPFNAGAKAALLAIAYRRGTPPVDAGMGPSEAAAKSLHYPEVETRFREAFPFVSLPS